MNLYPIIEALVQSGAPSESILAAVKAFEDQIENKKKERRLKDAERQRRHRMSRDVTVTVCDNRDISSPLVPPSQVSPTPPSNSPPYNPPNSKKNQTNVCQKKDGFDYWWEEYPHKVGKGAARLAYARALTKTNHEELVNGIIRYISTKPPDRDYCNPATWLNQERWNDQPAEIENATNRTIAKKSWKSEGERLSAKYAAEAELEEQTAACNHHKPSLRPAETVWQISGGAGDTG